MFYCLASDNGELIAYLKQQDPMLAGDPDKVLLRY